MEGHQTVSVALVARYNFDCLICFLLGSAPLGVELF